MQDLSGSEQDLCSLSSRLTAMDTTNSCGHYNHYKAAFLHIFTLHVSQFHLA